jgi:hypothetical protein
MIWTYRVFRDPIGRYSIREVYYERDGTMIGYSQEPVTVVDASLEDLVRLLTWHQAALDLPVLSTEEVDTQLATQPVRRPSPSDKNIPLSQVLAELETEAELVKV